MFRDTVKAAACGFGFLMVAVVPVRADFNTGLIDVGFNFDGGGTHSGVAVIGTAGDVWNGEGSGNPQNVNLNVVTRAASFKNSCL